MLGDTSKPYMLSVIVMSVVMLSVIMLNVVVPECHHRHSFKAILVFWYPDTE